MFKDLFRRSGNNKYGGKRNPVRDVSIDQAMLEIKRSRSRALVITNIGITLEWYDFFVYGTVAALVFPYYFFQEMFLGS